MTTREAKTPPLAQQLPVVDMIHGVEIVDDYRWLEDPSRTETRQFVEAQNAYTRSILDNLPGREALRSRLRHLLAIGTITAPEEGGNRLFYTRRQGDENQPRLLVRDQADGSDRVLVDPNRIDPAGGTTAIDWWYPSFDGNLVAVGLSNSGDEQSTMHLVDAASGKRLPDVIPGTWFATVAWLPDSSGFYYTSNLKNPDGTVSTDNYQRAVYLHHVGTQPDDDVIIFPDDGDPETQPSVSLSRNGRWLLVRVHRGWDPAQIHVCDLQRPGSEFFCLTEGLTGLFTVSVAGDMAVIHTNHNAPNYRLLAVSLGSPEQSNWIEIVPERADAVLDGFVVARDYIMLRYLRDARSSLVLVGLNGENPSDIELPETGSVTAMHGWEGGHSVFLAFESFTVPPTIYRFNTASGRLEIWDRVDSDVDVSQFRVEQIWYRSKDGTSISMFIIGPRTRASDGSGRLLLTGYGGFNVSQTPSFGRGMLAWLEAGDTLALPNLRGGGEYGEKWHQTGMLERKQNVFDDFIVAAEHLIAEGYTTPDRLGILGGSNGGLLVGAAFTQRPDLFRAVVCAVPLLDMLRYHDFLIARLWIPEYGSAENPDQFPYLRAYSPYHNVSDTVEYPAILFMTGDADSRVDPMHARKMTARMQGRVRSRGPILLRFEFEAGHGIGKPVAKLVEQYTDQWSFLRWQLGADW